MRPRVGDPRGRRRVAVVRDFPALDVVAVRAAHVRVRVREHHPELPLALAHDRLVPQARAVEPVQVQGRGVVHRANVDQNRRRRRRDAVGVEDDELDAARRRVGASGHVAVRHVPKRVPKGVGRRARRRVQKLLAASEGGGELEDAEGFVDGDAESADPARAEMRARANRREVHAGTRRDDGGGRGGGGGARAYARPPRGVRRGVRVPRLVRLGHAEALERGVDRVRHAHDRANERDAAGDVQVARRERERGVAALVVHQRRRVRVRREGRVQDELRRARRGREEAPPERAREEPRRAKAPRRDARRTHRARARPDRTTRDDTRRDARARARPPEPERTPRRGGEARLEGARRDGARARRGERS